MPLVLEEVLRDTATALEAALTEELGLFDECIRLVSGDPAMWRAKVERTLRAVTDRAGMSPPLWSAGRPARWLQTSHANLGRIGLTASGSALQLHLYAVPPRDRPQRVSVPCPAEVVQAFEDQD